MTEQNPNPVVVAIGHDPMDAALTYAAGEASRAGCGVHLVHVVHPVVQGPDSALMDSVDVESTGRLVIELAAERVRDLVSGAVPVTVELTRGAVVSTIVAAGATARLIVLQRRPLSRVMRVVTRSVSSGVAAHSRVPVVSVPDKWSPSHASGDVPLVTVGIDVPDRSEHILRMAAQAARSRGGCLRVLHAWGSPGGYDDMFVSSTEDAEWSSRARSEIQEVLDGMEDIADIPVTIEVDHARPGDALLEAGRTSELLVVGRHDPLVPIGSHLGPVARAVIGDATCPVLLADPHAARRWTSRRDRAETTQPV